MSETVQDNRKSSVVETYEFGTLGGLLNCLGSLAESQFADQMRGMTLKDEKGRAVSKLKICIMRQNGDLALEEIISAGRDFLDIP